MLTKEEFAAQAERGAAMLSAMPVTRSILYFLADQLKKGEPDWWKKTSKAWEKRKFVAWSEAWSLFVTCLHFEALNNEDHPLTSYFPSCGGTPEADISTALGRFLAEPSASFFENLRKGHRRYHDPALAGSWRMVADGYFDEIELPFHLVEVNAGAGLDIAADMINRGHAPFDSDLIQARIGLDPEPLLVQDIIHRRWLAASVFPDLTAVVSGLGDAVEKLADLQRKDTNFVQLVKCDAVLAPKFIAKNIPSDDPDIGLMVFNILTTGKMTDAELADYVGGLSKMMAPWGDRAVWFEAETVRGELYSTTIQYGVGRVVGDGFQKVNFGWVDLSSGRAEIDVKFAVDWLNRCRKK